jgi:hypothetical protein
MISKTIGEANCHGGSDAVACDIAERKTDGCGWCKAQQRGSTPQGDAIAETLMLQARNAILIISREHQIEVSRAPA